MKKDLKQIHDNLKAKYKDAVMPIGIKQVIKRTETGIIGLDYILGVSDVGVGFPEKSAVEFWGKEQSGKTTFSYKVIGYFQKQGKSCAHIDAENNFDEKWAMKNGVDVENLLKFKPDTLEIAGDIIVDLTIQGVDLIVVDSIIALIPEQELERDLDEPQRASQARVIAPMTRKLNEALIKSNTSYLFVNQIRVRMDKYGSPYKTAGGRALLHFYRIRVEFNKASGFIEIEDTRKYPGKKKGDKIRIGQAVVLITSKNQTFPPYQKATIDFYYKDGRIDNTKSLIYSCIKHGIINLKGTYYHCGKIKAQGYKNFEKYVDDKMYEDLKEKLWETLRFEKQD